CRDRPDLAEAWVPLRIGSIGCRCWFFLAADIACNRIQDLDEGRECHRSVYVTLRNMKAHAFCDQSGADHEQETKRQHDNRRIAPNEVGKWCGRDKHDGYCGNDGYNHDWQMGCHAHCRDDAVYG